MSEERLGIKFDGICLRQDSISFTHNNVVNFFIVCKLDTWSRDLNTDFTVGNSLFEAVKLTKNADPDKCGYSDCGIEFDAHFQFSWSNEWGKNVAIFKVDNSFSAHADNMKKIS